MMSVDQTLDEALWSALRGDGRGAVDILSGLGESAHWMDQVIRYVVQAALMGDEEGAALVFGGAATTAQILVADSLLSWTLKGLTARFAGDYDTAARSLVHAVEMDARDPWAVGSLALVLLEAGVVEDALHLATHATDSIPGLKGHPFVERVRRLVEAAFEAGASGQRG